MSVRLKSNPSQFCAINRVLSHGHRKDHNFFLEELRNRTAFRIAYIFHMEYFPFLFLDWSHGCIIVDCVLFFRIKSRFRKEEIIWYLRGFFGGRVHVLTFWGPSRPQEHKTHSLVGEITTLDKSSRMGRTGLEARMGRMRNSTYKIMVVKKTNGIRDFGLNIRQLSKYESWPLYAVNP